MICEKDFEAGARNMSTRSIFSIEEQEELGTFEKYINVSENSVLGKLFGYFFDN